jgi:gliding motility-associated-like protein
LDITKDSKKKKHIMRKSSQILAGIFLLVISVNFSFGQVTANFTANVTKGCGSLQVSFSDLSSSTAGSITAWAWDLDNVYPTVQNPGRIYGSAGSYTICLTATDTEGNSATACKTDYIKVFELPQPDFVADPGAGCSPLEVNFIDQSIAQDGDIVNWIWGVGGSAGVIVDNGTLPEISSNYTTPDLYTISLTVTDENGCINTITKNNFVTVSTDPVVDFFAPVSFSCTAPFMVNFLNNGNTQDMAFFWDFGNGTLFNGPHPPPVVYADFGSYTPCLIGLNIVSGCADTLCLTDYIQVGHPIEFSYSIDAGCEDLSVNFTDNSIDPANSVIWDFGDGNTSFAANPNHIYTTPGCYFVTLTREVNGCIAFETSPTCIEVYELPSLSYTHNNPIGCSVPHTVQFVSTTNTGISWSWNFGDGGTSNQQNPVYTYNTLGNFPVSLTVTNGNGCSSTITTENILIQQIQASVPSDTLEGCTPLDVSLISNSISPTPIVNWEWEVTNNSATPAVTFTDNSQSPNFILVDTGFYEIKLIVTNDIGCVDTATFNNLIAVGEPPIMAFDADPRISCVETPITFVGLTSENTNDWLWEFGDGGFGYGETPEHEYVDTGYFDITLFAYHHSCENQLTIDSFIYVNPPIAGFAVNTFCETPFYIEMVDNSVGADSIFWDFGIAGVDTDTSSLREPTYTYPLTGDFSITMTVYNFETGCQDDQTYFIQIRDINSDFNVTSPLEGCVPMIITFEDLSQDANAYSWTAAGGSFSNPTAASPSLTYSIPGTYTDIQQIVTDVNGCRDTLVFQDTIYANGITPDFTIDPSDGCRPLTVDFTDNSNSYFGNIIDWQWDFENGALNEAIQNPTTVFENIGAYDIRLTLIDDWGCTATTMVPDGVAVTFPLVSFHADTLSCTSLNVAFTNTSVGHTLNYQWDFGDGSPVATDNNPSHLYQNEGAYTVCLTATDVNGCDSTYCRNDYVVIADPVADLVGDSTYATCPPLIVNFDNLSINSNQFVWNFGDSSGTSTIVNPPHVYTEPGAFDLTLIASYNGYCADTLVIDDYIRVEGPIGSFSFDIDSACIPAVISFYGESADFYNFIWDFGNGNLDSTLNVMTDTMQYEYDMVGKFVPKLILEDFNSCVRAFESPDTIYLEELRVDFMVTDSVLCSGEDVTTFLNLSNSSLPIGSVDWFFDGGSPGTSNAFEPTINYNNPGVFDVILISNNGFCSDTLVKPAAIKVGETPVAAFSMSDSLGCPPLSITFNDLSTVSTGFISGWDWNYNDNTNGSTVQNPTHVFDGEGDFDVVLTVRTDIGCTDDASKTVSISAVPEVLIPEPYNICMGNMVVLEVEILSNPTGLNYYWLPNQSLSCTDCLNPEANPLDTTIYYFVVENNIGCSKTFEVLVEVRPFPAPIVNISNDTTICANTIIQITADGGLNVFEYQWDTSSPGLSCYNDCFNPIASPEVSTTYVVTVTNEFACETVEEVLVEVVDESQPFAGPDKTICEGSDIQLNINFGNDPVWMVTEGLSCAYCPDPLASPEETTTYIVSVTTDIGCQVIDTLVLNVMMESDVDAGTDQVICLGESIEMEAFGEGEIIWTPGNSLSANNLINPSASPTSSTTYLLSVTNDECTITDSIEIAVVERAEVFAENQVVCLGDNIMLEAYGSAQEFSWSPTIGLSDSTIYNPVATPEETMTYTVTGSLGTCEEDTAQVTVTVINGPETFLTSVFDFFPGQTVEVTVSTDGNAAYAYEWSPIEVVSCVSCNNPLITPDSTMSLAVMVTDPETGCWTIDNTVLRKNDTCPTDLIAVPNIFTPNNDGLNDELGLDLSPALQETGIELFRIFDRWGALIFESKNASETWDGTFKGKKMPTGVYIYFIEAQCPIGDGKIMKKGDITLFK